MMQQERELPHILLALLKLICTSFSMLLDWECKMLIPITLEFILIRNSAEQCKKQEYNESKNKNSNSTMIMLKK